MCRSFGYTGPTKLAPCFLTSTQLVGSQILFKAQQQHSETQILPRPLKPLLVQISIPLCAPTCHPKRANHCVLLRFTCALSSSAGYRVGLRILFSPPKFNKLFLVALPDSLQKKSSKFVHRFLSYPLNIETNKQRQNTYPPWRSTLKFILS